MTRPRKQAPMLMRAVMTGRVYIVTKYKDGPSEGVFEAIEKCDITDQFNELRGFMNLEDKRAEREFRKATKGPKR